MASKIKEISSLRSQINSDTGKMNELIMDELNKLKNKYFRLEEDGVVKISILHVSESNWENAVDYKRSFYCEGKEGHSWYQINEEMNFSREVYEVETALAMIEINKEEYEKSLAEIIEKARQMEEHKTRDKFNKLATIHKP